MNALLRVSITDLLVVMVAWPPPNAAYAVRRPPTVAVGRVTPLVVAG
ncbi:hypothetical protein ACFXGI_12650 [Streptomyces sp. NPDC059355]